MDDLLRKHIRHSIWLVLGMVMLIAVLAVLQKLITGEWPH